MLRFVLRRLLMIPPALVLVNFFGYAYAHVVLPLRAARTPYLLGRAESPPLLQGYGDYVQRAVRLDLGPPLARMAGRTLAEVLGEAILASMGLLAIALALSALIGVGLGLLSTRANPPRQARWLPVVSTVGLAMPSFYIGSLLILALFASVLWGEGNKLLLPLQGFGWDEHLVLPTLALVVRPAVQVAQVTSALLRDELGKQYVVAARSVGNSWAVVRRRHALRNILSSVVLTVAGSVRLLVGELILVEWLFRWPGLGYLFAQTLIPPRLSSGYGSTMFLNPPAAATILTIFAALFLWTDLVASFTVRAIDPRLRVEVEEVVHV